MSRKIGCDPAEGSHSFLKVSPGLSGAVHPKIVLNVRPRRRRAAWVWAALLLPALAFGAVNPSPLAPPPPPGPPPGPDIAALKKAFDRGQYRVVAEQLESTLAADLVPATSLADALLLVGEAHYRVRNFERAAARLEERRQRFPGQPLTAKVLLELGDAYRQLDQPQRAIAVLEDVAPDLEGPDRVVVQENLFNLYRAQREPVQALKALTAIEPNLDQPEQREILRNRIRRQVDELSDKDLGSVVSLYPRGFPGDEALLRRIQLSRDRGDRYLAEREARRFLRQFPAHPQIAEVNAVLQEIAAEVENQEGLIGVIVTTGSPDLRALAENVVQGVQVAVERAPESDRIGLVVREVEDPRNLVAEAEMLLRQNRVVALVGPLLSREVAAVAPVAERYRVPLITPGATAAALPSLGRYVFRNSYPPGAMAQVLARRAVEGLGLHRFVILYPENAYGNEMMREFSRQIAERGAELIHAQPYPPGATDFADEIQAVKKVDLEHYGSLVSPEEGQPQEGQPPSPGAKAPLAEEPVYRPGFDAVFLPGTARSTALIAGQLAFYDIEGVALLVPGEWNHADFLKIGGKFVEGAVVAESFYPDSSDPAVLDFVRRYKARYQESPDLFAAQAYDAARIVLGLWNAGAKSSDAIARSLTSVKGYPGVSGVTTFAADADVFKEPFLLQVKNGKMVVLR